MKYLLAAILCCFLGLASAQVEPVVWSMDSVDKDGQMTLVISADIDPTWKIYSRQTEEGGPIPMDIFFETEAELVDTYTEGAEPKTYHSDLFDMSVATFADDAAFYQQVGDYKPGTTVKAIVTFMTCNGKQCLPPTDVELEVTL